ncbi:hypothetical protein WJX75_008204 [Coccomyxa subellipsoidea]|uniref:Uncharacterized protein n=1 Tax=Coccomyxa subellipsoidea TaxID=248742 RepID=A0ABR2YYW5_9CHLO
MLGTLGKDPDTAETQRKKENLEKVRDLSQAIRVQNLAARSSSPTRQQPQQEQKKSSARERAQEYARSLFRAPSPSKRRRSRGEGSQEGNAGHPRGSVADQHLESLPSQSMAVMMDIEQLETLHGKQQKQVEQIYKEFGRGLAH